MRGGCLIPVIGLFCPRLVMIFLLLFTHWFERTFETVIIPIIGFVIMPYTTLGYLWGAINTNNNIHGEWLLVVIIAFLLDLGSSGYVARSRS